MQRGRQRDYTAANSVPKKQLDESSIEIRDFAVPAYAQEVRLDITMAINTKPIRLWGIVKNTYGVPLPFAKIQLIKRGNRTQPDQIVAEDFTNQYGYYEFNIQLLGKKECYRIIVVG